MNESIIRTIKLKYNCSRNFWSEYLTVLMKKQSNAIRFAYNRFEKNNLEQKEIRYLLSQLNNVTKDSHFINSAVQYANAIHNSKEVRNQKTLTFNQKAHNDYNKKKITKNQLKDERNFPVYSIAQAEFKGNVKYNFNSYNKFIFKPDRKNHFDLELYPSRNQIKYLQAIHYLANNKLAPITIAIDKEYIYMSFDINKIDDVKRQHIQNKRVLGIDMNPNRFGFVIKDTKEIYKAESLDFMNLRLFTLRGFKSNSKEKKYLNNKKTHEVIQAAYHVVNQAIQFHCEAIILEKLDGMITRTNNHHFNRSVNNDFKRVLFRDTIKKLCAERNITYIEILSPYTSFFGHVKYHDILSDPCTAAACIADAGIIELDRRSKGAARQAWFNQVQIDKSIYKNNSYLNRWNEKDLNFTSIKNLHRSIKKLCSNGDMYSSYHIPNQTNYVIWFKCQQSTVKRIIYI